MNLQGNIFLALRPRAESTPIVDQTLGLRHQDKIRDVEGKHGTRYPQKFVRPKNKFLLQIINFIL